MEILLINLTMFKLSTETRLPCSFRSEKKQDMMSSLLAELRQYWPSCSVSAEFITELYDSDRFWHIYTVLLIVNL